jgi:hypothetical protein
MALLLAVVRFNLVELPFFPSKISLSKSPVNLLTAYVFSQREYSVMQGRPRKSAGDSLDMRGQRL